MKCVLIVLLYVGAYVSAVHKGENPYESVEYSDEDDAKIEKKSNVNKHKEVYYGKKSERTDEKEDKFDYDEAQYEGYDRRYAKLRKGKSDENENSLRYDKEDLEFDGAQYKDNREIEKRQNIGIENETNNTEGPRKRNVASMKGDFGESVQRYDERTVPTEARLFTRRSYPDDISDEIQQIEKGTRRIFNADETAQIVDYPFMAAILFNDELWCSGVIIDADKVLTTAHCLQIQFNNRFFKEFVHMISVRVGSNNATSGGQVWNITQIYFHPHYRANTLAYNIAVIKLQNNITFDANIKSISYYKKTIELNHLNITFLGWGTVDDRSVRGGKVLLQKITLPIYNTKDCQEVYGSDLVTANNFCAGYISLMKNVCNHDAGGPALLDGEVLGLLSFTYSRCDVMDKPAVFVYIPNFLLWLDNIHDRAMNNHNIAG